MPKGYWIARMDVKDPERYKDYIEATKLAFGNYNVRYLVRGGALTNLEGTARGRNVVIEFESVEDALACYHSPEYQKAAAIRQEASEGELIVVAGNT